jgi:hypothetical protein
MRAQLLAMDIEALGVVHWPIRISSNADGEDFRPAKTFNNTYPGPWIQGCWEMLDLHFVSIGLSY